MVLPWRRRRSNHAQKKKDPKMEITIPSHFRCPISLDLMKDPVTLSTGITYDRESIEKWIESGNRTCPVTNQPLDISDQILVPNHAIRRVIQDWCVDHRSFGIERIPTPRVPVTSHDVAEISTRIKDATRRGDEGKCRELVGKIERWCKESERNKKCLGRNGAVSVLSSCFEAFCVVSMEKHAVLLEQILSVLTWMLPLGVEGLERLGSKASLRCMVGLLNNGDHSVKQNATVLLKEILCFDQRNVHGLMEIEGATEGLVKLIKIPICPSTTKSSLTVIYYMISCPDTNDKIISRFVETGLVSLVAEMTVDADKGICEKALSVLDAVSEFKQGREEEYKNALIVPLLVKKILRVSDLATGFAVSALWKLCKKDEIHGEGVLAEALEAGAFQKLLVVLQVGCEDGTKEKISDLLKMLNRLRAKLETTCVDSSMDLKHVKRPF